MTEFGKVLKKVVFEIDPNAKIKTSTNYRQDFHITEFGKCVEISCGDGKTYMIFLSKNFNTNTSDIKSNIIYKMYSVNKEMIVSYITEYLNKFFDMYDRGYGFFEFMLENKLYTLFTDVVFNIVIPKEDDVKNCLEDLMAEFEDNGEAIATILYVKNKLFPVDDNEDNLCL